MKVKMKMEKRSYRYNINKPRCRHDHKYSEYKKCLGMMMFTCIKQHLRNNWSSIHVKKSIAYKKSVQFIKR